MNGGRSSMAMVSQWAIALLTVIAVGVVVNAVRQPPPEGPDPSLAIEPAPDPEAAGEDIITCERTLPDVPTTPEGAPPPSPIGRVSSTEVIECPDTFDGHRVVFVGEVIGDVLERDDGAWVLMNDDAYALEVGPIPGAGELRGTNSGLSVWLQPEMAQLIEHPGGPRWRGDVLRVSGVVNRVDPADGGGLTVRAITADRIAPPIPLDPPINVPQAIAAGVAVLFALALTAVERLRARR